MSQGGDEEPASGLRPGQERGAQRAVQEEGGQLLLKVGLQRLIGLPQS